MHAFTITIACTTHYPIVTTILEKALERPAERFKMLQRFAAAIRKTATTTGDIDDWGVKIGAITVAIVPPEMEER